MVRGETFGDLLVTIRTDPDATLGVLLGLSLAGDARAGRVVLQTMLGKLVPRGTEDGALGAICVAHALFGGGFGVFGHAR